MNSKHYQLAFNNYRCIIGIFFWHRGLELFLSLESVLDLFRCNDNKSWCRAVVAANRTIKAAIFDDYSDGPYGFVQTTSISLAITIKEWAFYV